MTTYAQCSDCGQVRIVIELDDALQFTRLWNESLEPHQRLLQFEDYAFCSQCKSPARYFRRVDLQRPPLVATMPIAMDATWGWPTSYLRCQRCGAMYLVITADQARDAIAAFGDSAITLDHFYRCRLCSEDVAAFEPWWPYRNPLNGILPPVVQR